LANEKPGNMIGPKIHTLLFPVNGWNSSYGQLWPRPQIFKPLSPQSRKGRKVRKGGDANGKSGFSLFRL
jgi:hypothetical protein